MDREMLCAIVFFSILVSERLKKTKKKVKNLGDDDEALFVWSWELLRVQDSLDDSKQAENLI